MMRARFGLLGPIVPSAFLLRGRANPVTPALAAIYGDFDADS